MKEVVLGQPESIFGQFPSVCFLAIHFHGWPDYWFDNLFNRVADLTLNCLFESYIFENCSNCITTIKHLLIYLVYEIIILYAEDISNVRV